MSLSKIQIRNYEARHNIMTAKNYHVETQNFLN